MWLSFERMRETQETFPSFKEGMGATEFGKCKDLTLVDSKSVLTPG